MVVFVNLTHMDNWILLINVPENDLSIESTSDKNHRLSWMPFDFSHAVRCVDIESRFLGVECSSKWRENAHYRLILAPSHEIGLAIGNCQV